LTLASAAAEDDQLVEQEGANLFVANQVAPLLDDKTLDAQTEGEQVAFRLLEGGQAPAREAS